MTQTIIKIGSSAGVIIPKKVLDAFGLKVGDEVNVYISRPGEPPSDQQLFAETRKFMKIYGPALKRFADK